MGSYMSYALRFGFLNALYFLGGACLALENICYAPNTAFDGSELFAALNQTPVLMESDSAEMLATSQQIDVIDEAGSASNLENEVFTHLTILENIL